MKRIKVLYIIVGEGGSDIALLNFISNVPEEKVDPILFYGIDSDSALVSRYKSIRGTFYFDIWPKTGSFIDILLFPYRLIRSRLYNYLSYKKVFSIVLKNNIDLIHTNTGAFQFGYKAAKKLNIPHIWHLREYQRLMGFQSFPSEKVFISRLNDKNNFNIAITKGVHAYYSLNGNASVIYDGVMNKAKSRFEKNKSDYFLFVGALTKQKGFDLLINSFISFAKSDNSCELWIAAKNIKDKFTTKLKNKIISSGLEKRIKFLGFRDDIPELMVNAKALIVTSRSEGFGFTTAEAMFNGCLVIANNNTGIKEQLDNGKLTGNSEIGLRFENQKELTEILHEVASNEISVYSPMVKDAQKTVVDLYSIEKNTERVLEVYGNLMDD